jgi:signal transduction histidine kinase
MITTLLRRDQATRASAILAVLSWAGVFALGPARLHAAFLVASLALTLAVLGANAFSKSDVPRAFWWALCVAALVSLPLGEATQAGAGAFLTCLALFGALELRPPLAEEASFDDPGFRLWAVSVLAVGICAYAVSFTEARDGRAGEGLLWLAYAGILVRGLAVGLRSDRGPARLIDWLFWSAMLCLATRHFVSSSDETNEPIAQAFYSTAMLCFVLIGRAFVAVSDAPSRTALRALSRRPRRALVYSLVFSVVHLSLSTTLVGVSDQTAMHRDATVLVVLTLLGGLVALQHRTQVRTVADLLGRRERAMASLRQSQSASRDAAERATHQRLAARAAARAKSSFLAHMSHELRTPLNGVLGFARWLDDDPELPETARRGVTVIRSCGEHLLSVVNDILDWATVDAGKAKVVHDEVALEALLAGLGRYLSFRVEQEGRHFELHLPDHLPEGLSCDGRRLERTLANLCDHVLKSGKGDVQLHFSTSAQVVQFRLVCQKPAATTARGDGLELALARRLAALLRGYIHDESTRDGIVFALDLMRSSAPPAAPHAPESGAYPPVDATGLAELRLQARRGDLRRIVETIDQLLERDPALGPLARELRDLAASFRVNRIRELLERIETAR